jgi:membrane fusion protein (multidrug efflux system)
MLGETWVDANFKEDQLRSIRVGQTAKLEADIYGSKVVYSGRVVGLSPATGANLSLLPAQNATGNWVKVVQRLPVRIALDPEQLKNNPLQVGLSMHVTVDTSKKEGAQLTSAESVKAISTTIYETQLVDAEKHVQDMLNKAGKR